MNKTVALLASILLVIPNFVYSQTTGTQSTRALLQSVFEETSLPITISYSEIIADSVVVPHFEEATASEDTSQSGSIDYDKFTLLFKSLDSLTLHNIWSLEESGKKSRRDYYETYHLRATTFFQVNKKLYAFVMK